MILKSYAKLNLYLGVLRKRPDGYHEIKTLFERISLCDKIILKPLPHKSIKIICNARGLPKDKTNLAWRAARLLQETFKVKQGVEIKIVKNIPVAAGLAGGSSNAAAVLLGLNRLWKLRLAKKELIKLAAKLGSDAPFFIYDRPFALGEGRGDKITPLGGLTKRRLWHILAVPDFQVSTPLIYRGWDRQRAGLTRPKYGVKILTSGLRKNDLSLIGKGLFNGLEPVTTGLYPGLQELKLRLLDLGQQSILMSGSGPAIFGIVSSKKEALRVSRQLKKSKFLRTFVAQTH